MLPRFAAFLWCVCLLWAGCSGPGFDRNRCLAALDTMQTQQQERAHGVKIRLPSEFSSLSHDGTAVLYRMADRAPFLLVKSRVGWKGNYEGFLCGRRALGPDEAEQLEQFSYRLGSGVLPNAGTPKATTEYHEQLMIRKQLAPGSYAVYFDAN
jgi:hypothetical protein